MPLPFLDTNILIRHFTQDNADHSPRATAYLTRIERGELQVTTAETVIFEAVFILQRLYARSRAEIHDELLPIIALPGIVLPGKRRLRRAPALFAANNLAFADCFHVALMEDRGLTETASFDRGFDRIPGISRVEP